MCEFNSPGFLSSGHCLDNPFQRSYVHTEPTVLPPAAWELQAAELPDREVEVINQAVQDAATIQADVHLYRSVGSSFLGIALQPGNGPNVKIWEH